MRALTIRQPYAEAIMRGEKTVENRSWRTDHRGLLVVHTGIRYDEGGFELPHGVILGVVELVDVHASALNGCLYSGDECTSEGGAHWNDTDWHWVLARPHRFVKPIPFAGRRFLWYVTGEIADQITSGLESNRRVL